MTTSGDQARRCRRPRACATVRWRGPDSRHEDEAQPRSAVRRSEENGEEGRKGGLLLAHPEYLDQYEERSNSNGNQDERADDPEGATSPDVGIG